MSTYTVLPEDVCPRCGPHERVYSLVDIVEGRSTGLAARSTVAPDRVASLRDALAIPNVAPRITVEYLLRAYNYAATASRLFGFHLPHLSKGSYGCIATICGVFALVFLTLVGEKPVQAILVSAVFAALCVFFTLRRREAERRAREQRRLEQERTARWESLRYRDQCQAVFSAGSSDAIPPTAVRDYVATRDATAPALSLP